MRKRPGPAITGAGASALEPDLNGSYCPGYGTVQLTSFVQAEAPCAPVARTR
jgi:hypothetical protein